MKIARAIFVLLAIFWLFAVISSYYIVHKPFTADILQTVGRSLASFSIKPLTFDNLYALGATLANVVVAFAIFLLAAGLGRRVTRTLEFASSLEAISLRAGLGLALLSFATLGLGLLGLLNSVLFWVLLLAGALYLRRDLVASLDEIRNFHLVISSRFERALAAFVGISLILAFFFALTPPVGWDSQTYHLVEARNALAQGRIAPPPDIVYFSFPSLGEMLFTLTMLLRGDIAAQLTHFVYLFLTLAAVYAFANRLFSSQIAWLTCAILVGVPSLLAVSTWAYVDVTLVFYTFAAFYALITALEKNQARWYALAGVFSGIAMGVKYTGIIVPVAIFIVMLLPPYSVLRRPSLAFSFLLSGLCFALPFYLRNLVFTGNPVYPFVLGGPYWDSFRAEWFSRFGSGLITSPLRLVTAPWDATVFGLEGANDYSATIGPSLLALLPLLILSTLVTKFNNARHASQRTSDESRFAAYVPQTLFVFAFILYLFWLYGIAQSKLLVQTRLLYPAFPALALGAAIALDRLDVLHSARFSIQHFARLLVVFVMGLTLLNYAVAFVASNPLAFITGAVSRDAFLEGALGDYYRTVEFINAELPRDAQLVALWEPRSYYIQRSIQPDVILDLFEHRLAQTRDVDALARGWRNVGYTHVLLYRRGLNQLVTTQYDPISLDDLSILQALLARYGHLIYGEPLVIDGGGIVDAETAPYSIYALESR